MRRLRTLVWQYALNLLGMSRIYLINRDEAETAAIVAQFAHLDLRPLQTITSAQQALRELDAQGLKLVAGVGAIPSIEPVTEAEKNVYEIAKVVFAHKYDSGSVTSASSGHLPYPSKPTFLEMAYKVSQWTAKGRPARDAEHCMDLATHDHYARHC